MKGVISRLWVMAFFLAVVWGCVNLGEGTKEKTRFFVLQSLAESKGTAPKATSHMAVGVGPVQLPEYLARPQIITRIGPNRLQINEFYRWAEPLTDSFARVLGENLAILLSSNQVFVHPWKVSTALGYQVTVDVTRFDGDLDEDVTLDTVWTIYDGRGKTLLLRKNEQYKEAVHGGDFEDLALALSRSLEALSRDIAEGIQAVHSNRE